MADTPSLADTLYEEITAVIGGDNPNQFFCMGLPGTLIDPTQYAYDVENNEPKPAHVKANESKLANKLFDACLMTSSDNGRHLYTQYKTALNMLMPKLNGKLFEAKTKLREVMMTPYPYNFEDGNNEVLTLEQVFYKLYSDYIDAKQAWAQKQIDKKEELENQYPQATEEAYKKRNDEFLDWYGLVGETEELVVDEKLGKVLSVFSPGDMDIINGILESGVGRELHEARTTLSNVEELNPDGGYVYPVTFYPQNWFELLETSFTEVDLLESPAALAQRLQLLEMQKSNITANINQFLQVVPDESVVGTLKNDYEDCENAYKTAFSDYIANNTNVTMDMFKSAVDIIAANNNHPEALNASTVKRIFGVADATQVSTLLEKLKDGATSCLEAQNKLVNSADAAVSAANDYFSQKNMLQMKNMLAPLKQQLDDVNAEIELQKQKIALATVMKADETETDGKAEIPDTSGVAPNQVPDRFTQILINTKMSSLSQQSSKSADSSQSSHGVSFFFGGYSTSQSHQSSVEQEMSSNSSMEIQIGMSVAKVQIEREWFNPGVFMLTADMYNTASTGISPMDDTSFADEDTSKVLNRLNRMNKCVFSCYPTAFVIAKDVTIKFVSESAISSAFAQSVEEHSSKGGGFFIFGGSSAQASSSSSSSSSASSTAHSVTIRFSAPQILGYYIEAVPADLSTSISSVQTNSNSDFISIFEFITKFQEMLEDHNKKYHKSILSE